MTEQWAAFRDGYIAARVALGLAKARGGTSTPSYVQVERRSTPSPEQQALNLANLGMMFPGAVVTNRKPD